MRGTHEGLEREVQLVRTRDSEHTRGVWDRKARTLVALEAPGLSVG